MRVRVSCFRGVEEASLDLAPLTVVTGRNNSGKSSLLEALAVLFSAPTLESPVIGDVINYIRASKGLRGYASLVRDSCSHAEVLAESESLRIGVWIYRIDGQSSSYITVKLLEHLMSEDTARRLASCIGRQLGEGLTPRLLSNIVATLYSILARYMIDFLDSRVKRFYEPLVATDKCPHVPIEIVYPPADEFARDRLARLIPPTRSDKIIEVIVKTLTEKQEVLKSLVNRLKLGLAATLAGSALVVSQGCIDGCGFTLRRVYEAGLEPQALRDELEDAYRRMLAPVLFEVLELLGDMEALKLATEAHVSGVLGEALTTCLLEVTGEWLRHMLPKRDLAAFCAAKPIGPEELSERLKPAFCVVFHARRAGLKPGVVAEMVKRVYQLGSIGEYREMISWYGVEEPWFMDGRLVVRYEGRVVDAASLGDGLLALLQLYSGLAMAKRGGATLLIEEPEAGLHPGYMARLAMDLVKIVSASRGVYVIVSTHSIELIEYLLEAAREEGILDKVKVALMRKGRVALETSGGNALEYIEEFGAELRGV